MVYGQALGEAAPAEALLALAGLIKEALAGKQDADKPRTWAAAEALAGLLASGALFVPGPGEQLSHAFLPHCVLHTFVPLSAHSTASDIRFVARLHSHCMVMLQQPDC